jgi:hypothetical protein
MGQYAVFVLEIRTHVARDAEGRFPVEGDASVAICEDLHEAAECARSIVFRHPQLCREIYDHEGKAGAPLQVIYNPAVEGRYQGRPYARRVTAWGSGIFLCGAALIALDMRRDLAWIWGYVLGLKMVIVGTGLLVHGLAGLYELRKCSENRLGHE